MKRDLARHLPLLSRVVGSLDWLEAENARLRELVARLEAAHLSDCTTGAGAAELAEDGLPVPPALLQQWVTGAVGPGFLVLGKRGADTIVDLLARNHIGLGDLGRVLDFGCGSGRVIRHLAGFDSVELHGTDYNRTAVAWCDANLRFAQFGSNQADPPTRYRAASFDLVYAFSVFTHLDEGRQRPWMAELRRILKARGYLILSTHGSQCSGALAPAARARFDRGELVVVAPERSGRNECGAFHPESIVRRELAAGFDVLEFAPGGALGNPPQDVWLLQRRE